MTVPKGKRPRDPNQLAKWTVEVSTGQIPAPEAPAPPASVTPPANLSEYMAAIGRKGRSDRRQAAAQDHDQRAAQASGSKGCAE